MGQEYKIIFIYIFERQAFILIGILLVPKTNIPHHGIMISPPNTFSSTYK